MIRYNYINRLVLQIYYSMDKIVFPINPLEIVKQFTNCCTIDEVIEVCKSKSGCTHFDLDTGRYLILCNESPNGNNNPGRQRWTLLHEIGHIVCNHLNSSAIEMLSENNTSETGNKEYELEADYFAATAVAPFPLFKELSVKSALDAQQVFGLSTEASTHRFTQFLKWQEDHRKTSWENDMVQTYRRKNNIPIYTTP